MIHQNHLQGNLLQDMLQLVGKLLHQNHLQGKLLQDMLQLVGNHLPLLEHLLQNKEMLPTREPGLGDISTVAMLKEVRRVLALLTCDVMLQIKKLLDPMLNLLCCNGQVSLLPYHSCWCLFWVMQAML
jgi:hypothetical protein